MCFIGTLTSQSGVLGVRSKSIQKHITQQPWTTYNTRHYPRYLACALLLPPGMFQPYYKYALLLALGPGLFPQVPCLPLLPALL